MAGRRAFKMYRPGEDEDEHANTSWKIAYADFVTAMMAFFLMLWLITALTQEQRQALADYFSAISISSAQSGAGDIFSGRAVFSDEGSLTEPVGHELETNPDEVLPVQAPVGPTTAKPDAPEQQQFLVCTTAESVKDRMDAQTMARLEQLAAGSAATTIAPAKPQTSAPNSEPSPAKQQEKASLGKQILSIWGETSWQAQSDAAIFEDVQDDLQQRLHAAVELRDLSDAVRIEQTPAGLRIQITDRPGFAMFPSGRTELTARARDLLRLLAEALGPVPNPLTIAGHTDARPYRGAGYSNWELSSDRAHAARRLLQGAGIGEARVARVAGFADKDPILPDAPMDAKNRRISITLMRRD